MALQFACQAFAVADDVLEAPDGCPFEPTDDVQSFIDMATDIMFQLTHGRVHGICTSTVYPMTEERHCGPRGWEGRASWSNDGWLGGTIIHPGPSIRDQFGGHTPIRLAGPNTTIVSVVVDGVALVAGQDWILVNGVYLIRRDGKDWPTRNNILQPSGVGTWSITYSYGRAPDQLTKIACVELAIDLAKAVGIGTTKGFGPGVIAANVQGVQLSIEDLAQQYAAGRQSVPALDRFLGIYHEGPVSDVYSPELDIYELLHVSFS